MRRALILLFTALPGWATAAIPPCARDQLVAAAPVVVQVDGIAVGRPDAAGLCHLSGTVRRTFQGALVEEGAVEATFPCANPDNIAGPQTYHDRDQIASAPVVELHLEETGAVAGHGWGLMRLDAPTAEPAFPFEHLTASGACR